MTAEDQNEPIDEPALIARLARCAAALYRDVPREGTGIAVQAEEIAHASDLDLLADALESGADVDLDDVLRPDDIRAVCRLLLDVRRSPMIVSERERALAREHFPEVEAPSLDPLESLVSYYTALLHDG